MLRIFMKKSLILLMTALCSVSAMAQTTLPTLGTTAPAPVYTEENTTTLTSPRTGIEYTLSNPQKIKYVMRVEKIVPANEQTVKRIIAKNPALSTQSQEQARQTLLQK